MKQNKMMEAKNVTTIVWLIPVLLSFLYPVGTHAQKTEKKPKAQKPQTERSAADTAEDEKKVRDLVSFFGFMLNTLGSNETPTRDKDVLVSESFSKIFKDAKVQIEDDLDEERGMVTYKDVVAYLKDVDFFFENVQFEFTVEDVKAGVNAFGNSYYKVSLRRSLNGVTSEGKTVSNRMPRFIEINYNPEDQDLKIVSIYTKEINEKQALMNWWKELSYEWESIFRRKLNLIDTVTLGDIRNVTFIKELDLTGNQYIQTLEPLAQLHYLKSLNISNTNIDDLTPIRNMSELAELDLSNTPVTDISPLKYVNKLVSLDLSHTSVSDISVLEKMSKLQYLGLTSTQVSDFNVLSHLTSLTQLDLERTSIHDLSPIKDLAQIQEIGVARTGVENLNPLSNLINLNTLNIDSTRVFDLSPLAPLKNLKVLYANYTPLSDLRPIQHLAQLERVYCDQTNISQEMVHTFMAGNPRALVILDSKDLKAWWDALSEEWQQVFTTSAHIKSYPQKEELAKVTSLDSINLSGKAFIRNLEPLRKLQKLQTVIVKKTRIEDLSPLQEHREIRVLDISGTEVSDLSPLGQFSKLKVLRADKTKIENFDVLYGLNGLERFYADDTGVNDLITKDLLERNPNCLVVYKTEKLNRWWRGLPRTWQAVFLDKMEPKNPESRETLHKLVEREDVFFNEVDVTDLLALSEFVRLKELHFSGTAIADLSPLASLGSLRSLKATNSPVQGIAALEKLSNLEELDLSNTPLYDLKEIRTLKNLRKLNCSGTPIKKLDALKKLEKLEHLDCSNTKVSSLKPVAHLPLKMLKCYNTKISSGEIKKFKKRNPQCNVVYYR